MSDVQARVRRVLPPLGAAAALIVIFVTVLSIPLATARTLELSDSETVGWIMGLYGLPGLLTLVLTARYRQPLLVTGNVFLLIFIASLGVDMAWPQLVGAVAVAGAIVLVLGPTGIIGGLADWLPPPIVYGLLAGAVLHFFVDLFSAAGSEPLMVGGTLVVYLLGRRLVEPRIPALLPALVTGILLAALTGEIGAAPTDVSFAPALTAPAFTLQAILTVAPVTVVLITLQANIPSLVYLRSEGYEPPDTALNAISGVGTAAGSLLGPMGVSLSLPATALCAGPDAGDKERRHWAAYVAGGASLAIGLGAGLAAQVADAIPDALLAGLVGLAVVGVLATALRETMGGPLALGPLFAFGISQSSLEIAGLGPFFWALAGGLAISWLLERDKWPSTSTSGAD